MYFWRLVLLDNADYELQKQIKSLNNTRERNFANAIWVPNDKIGCTI